LNLSEKPTDRVETTDFGILLGLFLAMGCDADFPTAKRLYKQIKHPVEYKEGELSINIIEYA
jgi:hypothetical protein